jgi:hypothetical protein
MQTRIVGKPVEVLQHNEIWPARVETVAGASSSGNRHEPEQS